MHTDLKKTSDFKLFADQPTDIVTYRAVITTKNILNKELSREKCGLRRLYVVDKIKLFTHNISNKFLLQPMRLT